MSATAAAQYASLHTYPFQSDVEFRAGLSQILQRPVTDAELLSSSRQSQQDAALAGGNSDVNETILRAKCFYFSRKNNISPPLDPSGYRTWLGQTRTTLEASTSLPRSSFDGKRGRPESIAAAQLQALNNDRNGEPKEHADHQHDQSTEPAYPSSFAHIVELITTGQPIPGIQHVPDTVLTGHDKPPSASIRRKPWEKDEKEQESK